MVLLSLPRIKAHPDTMRIAFVVREFPAPSETFILNQITGLIDKGHEIDIFASRPTVTAIAHADYQRYRLVDRTYYRARMIRNRWLRVLKGVGLVVSFAWRDPVVLLRAANIRKYGRLAASLEMLFAVLPMLGKRPAYDIIHCHFGEFGCQALALRQIGAIRGKLITSFHGYDLTNYPRKHGANVYQELFRHADRIIANTAFTHRSLVKLRCPSEKIVRLPSGLKIDRFRFLRRSLDKDGVIRIVTIGRLVECKGLEYGIKAIGKLVSQYPTVRYSIIGDGPLKANLEQLIADLDLSTNVQLLGWKTQDQVREIYADTHIFMLPSIVASTGDEESQGLSLQEAQAMGIPVVSTRIGGIPEGLIDGKSGFLVPEKDVDSIADRIRYLIEHTELWSEMGKAGRAFVEQYYDIDKLNDQLEDIYRNLLKE